jgi:hypothetical protein
MRANQKHDCLASGPCGIALGLVLHCRDVWCFVLGSTVCQRAKGFCFTAKVHKQQTLASRLQWVLYGCNGSIPVYTYMYMTLLRIISIHRRSRNSASSDVLIGDLSVHLHLQRAL